jgi:AraC family transcriptional regulator, positive regulator of tynA and feaB
VTGMPVPSSLDLQRVDEAQRALTWARSASAFFPGLSVRDLRANPARGSICGTSLGAGQVWTILSPPVQVSYRPRGPLDPAAEMFSVMLQLQGSTSAMQGGQSCRLRPRDLCLIDGYAPFELEVREEFSRLMFLRVPRAMVLSRHPYLERQTARTFDPDEAGTRLLRAVLHGLLDAAPFLQDEQGAVALAGAVQLLGASQPPGGFRSAASNWRVRAALALIEADLSDPSLTANRVARAQKISRRRLDEILLETVGLSLSAHIWQRRLAQAASDLRDSRLAGRTVTQIAFGMGFTNTAHFTRAFKRRYGCSPRDWRATGAVASN